MWEWEEDGEVVSSKHPYPGRDNEVFAMGWEFTSAPNLIHRLWQHQELRNVRSSVRGSQGVKVGKEGEEGVGWSNKKEYTGRMGLLLHLSASSPAGHHSRSDEKR